MNTRTGQFAMLLVAALASWQCSRPETSAPPATPAPTSSALQTAISAKSASFVDDGDRGRHSRREAQRFYQQNGYQLAWSDGTRPRSTIDALITAVRAADQDGLEPSTYHVDELDAARKGTLNAEQAIALDLRASYTYLRYAAADDTFDPKTAAFAISYHDETSAYRDAAVLVMPGAAVVVDAVGGPPGDYAAATDAGTLQQQGAHHWRWIAPVRPGSYTITFQGPEKKHGAIELHAFVLVPASQVRNGLLNGYHIGEYPAPLKGNPLYLPPPGFIEVTKDNQDTHVSPHFTLKQFLCKEDTAKTFPKYVLLKERLALKLERVLERVNAMGFKTDTLHVMSAFRTPFYNHAIGDVKYSLHQWGSAADIYIDPQKKDRMADLNRDGQVDVQDSKFLYDEIERMLISRDFARFQGGMGFYPATYAHPPFVHVDVRGTAARWKG